MRHFAIFMNSSSLGNLLHSFTDYNTPIRLNYIGRVFLHLYIYLQCFPFQLSTMSGSQSRDKILSKLQSQNIKLRNQVLRVDREIQGSQSRDKILSKLQSQNIKLRNQVLRVDREIQKTEIKSTEKQGSSMASEQSLQKETKNAYRTIQNYELEIKKLARNSTLSSIREINRIEGIITQEQAIRSKLKAQLVQFKKEMAINEKKLTHAKSAENRNKIKSLFEEIACLRNVLRELKEGKQKKNRMFQAQCQYISKLKAQIANSNQCEVQVQVQHLNRWQEFKKVQMEIELLKKTLAVNEKNIVSLKLQEKSAAEINRVKLMQLQKLQQEIQSTEVQIERVRKNISFDNLKPRRHVTDSSIANVRKKKISQRVSKFVQSCQPCRVAGVNTDAIQFSDKDIMVENPNKNVLLTGVTVYIHNYLICGIQGSYNFEIEGKTHAISQISACTMEKFECQPQEFIVSVSGAFTSDAQLTSLGVYTSKFRHHRFAGRRLHKTDTKFELSEYSKASGYLFGAFKNNAICQIGVDFQQLRF